MYVYVVKGPCSRRANYSKIAAQNLFYAIPSTYKMYAITVQAEIIRKMLL
jgi:hypothetical protein